MFEEVGIGLAGDAAAVNVDAAGSLTFTHIFGFA